MEGVSNILSIAGSDSCGGAGMQADIKTAMGLGCHCCTAFVVLTAQNTKEVKRIVEIEESFIVEQLDSIFADVAIDVVKLGVLYSKKVISLVHEYIINMNKKRGKKLLVVFDPVFVSSSGCLLVENLEYIKFALDLICPISCIITPNFYECKVILEALDCQMDLSKANMTELCKLVTEKLNINACLFKSCNVGENSAEENEVYAVDHLCIRRVGSTPGGEAAQMDAGGVTYLYDVYKLRSKRKPGLDIHGTGCTLSTAIACYLAKEHNILQSCIESKKYIYNCIRYAYPFGGKSLGLNHLRASQELPTFTDLDVIPIVQGSP
ncbi:phosphomethylpyrimidine kinase, putative [Plasmodium vivax]|uniref:Phosphomethylpyrimidine kinase, putative n=6 Tax=Plasmodium vivax TaxID=5855 RepID=A5K9F3_PLAVS|nr:phosphomethylpyrimidine kinase, putative [Plasmodium vivax]KMZ80167.1 phosphomethylpyrimidine kinase [Plasmodium vivax India VII]KMZ86253.1 phosphomethylpyrimidine kinase [Plasmodium vivax Brazil I]KMZ92613.1 phosphomethylpyrimidine kinase [Plasmodium vivax Mauritania I]KMZ99163.1 phosphomethylpyrimidine kinase [Plasmodium vivax North Korean]EDL44025.1 phosphomethylpyrimidine kinase, putative [Plasmodium vivax]|eukprot:XP_001613752.1 phosphomethylpyrimidine kinase [Plasmodium vivax Sal-1]